MGRTGSPRFLLVAYMNKNVENGVPEQIVLGSGRLLKRGDRSTLNLGAIARLLLVEGGACLKETLHVGFFFLLQDWGLKEKWSYTELTGNLLTSGDGCLPSQYKKYSFSGECTH